jgi:hypothetical protein
MNADFDTFRKSKLPSAVENRTCRRQLKIEKAIGRSPLARFSGGMFLATMSLPPPPSQQRSWPEKMF